MKEQELLRVASIKCRKSLEKDTLDLVHAFYNHDEYSRVMPGKKKAVSISRNVHAKRLILCNLKELFEAFKEKHPDTKIGFSKFCSLKTKVGMLDSSMSELPNWRFCDRLFKWDICWVWEWPGVDTYWSLLPKHYEDWGFYRNNLQFIAGINQITSWISSTKER